MTKIQEKLLEALSASLKGESVEWEPLSQEDLSELYNLAHIHQILPLVYEAVYKSRGVNPQVKSYFYACSYDSGTFYKRFLTAC